MNCSVWGAREDMLPGPAVLFQPADQSPPGPGQPPVRCQDPRALPFARAWTPCSRPASSPATRERIKRDRGHWTWRPQNAKLGGGGGWFPSAAPAAGEQLGPEEGRAGAAHLDGAGGTRVALKGRDRGGPTPWDIPAGRGQRAAHIWSPDKEGRTPIWPGTVRVWGQSVPPLGPVGPGHLWVPQEVERRGRAAESGCFFFLLFVFSFLGVVVGSCAPSKGCWGGVRVLTPRRRLGSDSGAPAPGGAGLGRGRGSRRAA